MKASLKFRDEQKPLLRAKVPLSILGLPFQSGICAGESKELTLHLATFFESGPSFKVAYRPNDSWNPFSLVIKTGTGPFGSPVSSSMLMSAEFSLLGRGGVGGSPAFMLHFKPSFGDFSIKKKQTSTVLEKAATVGMVESGVVSEEDSTIEVVDLSPDKKKITMLPAGDLARALSGVEVAARTSLPLRGRAAVNFRWGVRIPPEMKGGVGGSEGGLCTDGFSFRKLPFLVMNKIGIEHVDSADSKETSTSKTAPVSGAADVTEVCYSMKHQLEMLQAENGLLKKAVDDLRQEIVGGNFGNSNSGKHREMERNGFSKSSGSKFERRNNNDKKSVESDVNEESKKAIKGAGNS